MLSPVVVMATGQLAGGLAWLSISGEDAPDLIASAPIVAVLVLDALYAGLGTALAMLTAAASATLIQICFRTQAKRSQFRRRQTSSRIATFAEAFSSIAWAAASALAAAACRFAQFPALIAIGILAGTRIISPSGQANAAL